MITKGKQIKEFSDRMDELYTKWLKGSSLSEKDIISIRKCDGFRIITEQDENELQEVYIIYKMNKTDDMWIQLGAAFKPADRNHVKDFIMECSMVLLKLASVMDKKNEELNDDGAWTGSHFNHIVKKWFRSIQESE